jgi:hypothetical protein
MPYQVLDPAPTQRPNSNYYHTGRGGAGNMRKSSPPPTSLNTKRPSLDKRVSLAHSTTNMSTLSRAAGSKGSTGRGGAGNIRPVADLPLFSFDEEMDAQAAREEKERSGSIFHVGRGGAGNWSTAKNEKRGSTGEEMMRGRKDSNESADSNASVRSGILGRISGVFERR